MGEVRDKVFKQGDKAVQAVSVQEFREKYCEGISAQSVNYAIDKDLIDYVRIDDRIKLIALTPKTLAYKPNPNKNRGVGFRIKENKIKSRLKL